MTAETKTYTSEQQAENRAKWVAALRSGDYPQTRNRLTDSEGFCCLGVACEVAIAEGAWTGRRDGDAYVQGVMDSGYLPTWVTVLPEGVQAWLGLAESTGPLTESPGDTDASALTDLNDDWGYTFAQLASLIESGKVVVQS